MAEWRTDTKEKTVLCKGVAHKVTETVQVCSNCGTEKYEGLDADLWSDWNVKYCPHCGAEIPEEAKLRHRFIMQFNMEK